MAAVFQYSTARRRGFDGGIRGSSGRQARGGRAGLRWWMVPFALLALAVSTPARAEEPLWGEIASTLGKGFLNVTTRASLYESRPYRHHGGPVSLTIGKTDVAASVEYGLRSDLDLRLRIPYFFETLEQRFAGQSTKSSINGLGEMQVGAKWRVWQSIGDNRKDELSLLTDLKLPTGDNELRDENGALITPHLQPNSGNPGITLGLAANRHTDLGGYWFSGMVTVEAASQRYRRGEMMELHLSTGRRVRPLSESVRTDWMGIVGLHYHLMGKDEEGGRTLRDSGGSVLGAELGLVGTHRDRGARLGVMLPLYTALGQAHAPPRWEIQASLRASF
jgi:hypothetical protein